MPAGDLGDRVDVGEVDRLGDVGDLQPERVGVAVDGDDANALLARLQDRAPLVAPGADEEDGLHTGRCYWRADQLPMGLPLCLPRQRNETRFHRAISQPSRWLSLAQIRRPG